MATAKQSGKLAEEIQAAAKKEPEESKQSPVKKTVGDTAKTAARKTQTRKTAKKEPKTKIVMEFAGKQVDTKDALSRALKAYGKSHRGVEVKTVELYIVTEESAAYYVINGEADNEFKIDL